MGRAPCCDKNNVKKGPWSPEEDATLKAYIEENGTGGNWIALPQKIGLKRCGKSCRLRWLNYLRPNIKHGGFSEEEDNIICSLFISIGSRWSIIAAQLPGRTDNDIKNYWNTRLKKKLFGRQRRERGQAAAAGNTARQKQAEMRKAVARENPTMMMAPQLGNNTDTTPPNNPWPELPVLNPVRFAAAENNEPGFNDQQSIRNLLIKLGGRFEDNYHHNHKNLTYPAEDSSVIFPPPMDSLNAAAATNSPNLSTITEYNLEIPNLPSNTAENCFLDQMVYANNNDSVPQKLDGLDFLYDNSFNDDENNGGRLGSATGMDWGEMMSYCTSAFPPPPLPSSAYTCLQPVTVLAAAQPEPAVFADEELISYSRTQ